MEAEVRTALAELEAAERALDADAVLAFLSPDFGMLQDGARVDRADTVTQIGSSLPALRSFEPRFEDVEVRVLGPDAALSSMIFRDEVVDAEGETHLAWGPSTMLWRREDGRWRIVFADSDHYPVDAQSDPGGE